MGLINGFKNLWNLASTCGDIPMYDTLKHMDFFSYSGDNCIPGFCVDLSCSSGLEKAYRECAPLSTVINRNAMAMANAKWWLTDTEDNEPQGFENLKKLLKRPNPLQSWTELILQLDTYRQIYGEVFLWAPTGEGNSIQDAMALWAIKPEYITIKLSKKLYFQNDINDIVLNYYLKVGDSRTEFDGSRLLHIKDTFQNLCFSPTNIRGESRISGLEHPIKNIIQAYEAIYSLNKDRGAQGILSNDRKDVLGAMALTEKEKKDIQSQYLTKYGLNNNQRKVIITDASLRWQSMSYNVRDLMLFEGIKSNVEQISDSFLYPFNLLANQKGTTYDNNNESKKTLYQDNIIPISKIYSEKLTSFFGLDDTKVKLYADFSEIECLQEGEKEKAEALNIKISALSKAYQDKAITLEEYRAGIDYDEKANGGTYYNEEN